MKIGVFGGSFDPLTLGHMDLIRRSAKLVDRLIVVVLDNPKKSTLFTLQERKDQITMVVSELENVEVDSYEGLMVDFAKEKGATVAFRGLRNAVDFATEYQMHLINRKLNEEIETVFLAADEEHIALSSTNVKEVAKFDGRIDFMVPKEIEPLIMKKMKK
ncbi:MAG: pantetheine-phosphate adenylyltransferase [Bacillota bacterium]